MIQTYIDTEQQRNMIYEAGVLKKTVLPLIKLHTAATPLKLIRLLPLFMRRKVECRPGLAKILDNIGWLFIDKILRMGVGLLVGVWVARYLGPEQFGQFNYALAFVGIFGAIAGLGLNSIVVRDIVRDPQSADTTLGTAFVMQAVGGLLAILVINIAITWIHPDDEFTRVIVAILSLSLLFKAADVVRFWFESQIQSRYIVWVENSAFLLMAAIKVAMILSQASLLAFVWLSLAEAAVVAVGLLAIYAMKGGHFHRWQSNSVRSQSLFRDSWPLLLAGLAVTIYMRVDMVMLQEMSGAHEVGIYAAATRLSEIWYFLPMVIVGSVSPSIIKCHSTDAALYIARLRNLYFLMVWLAIALSLPISLLSRQIISILYGKEFEEAASVLAIHLWASLAVFLGAASSQHLLVNGWLKISFYRTLIGMVSNIILNLLMIPSMGAVGAAIATVISYFIATFSLVFFKGTRYHAIYLLVAPFNKTNFR